jgi:hypothetical protein
MPTTTPIEQVSKKAEDRALWAQYGAAKGPGCSRRRLPAMPNRAGTGGGDRAGMGTTRCAAMRRPMHERGCRFPG